ncbi:MAG TPA: hypothetical protein VNH11_07380 [Pirellulales bacterium]|nr:hypothetical protein [Pirellulales bacterium]
MKGEPNIMAVWKNLPDPTPTASCGASTSIIVSERTWRHFVEKHVCKSSEPWRDVFAEAIVKELAATPHGPFDQGPAADASKAALAILEGEVRSCLSQPLVLVYTSIGARGVDGQRWLLPLPSGAIAVVNSTAAEKTLRTCYFTGAASVDPTGTGNVAFKSRRWKIALKQLVYEHTDADPVSQRRRLPDRGYRREKSVIGGQPEMCIDIRFVDPQIWGFVGGAAGSEWATPTWTWETR